MKKFLFTIGVGVTDRPQRWRGICAIYAHLAHALVEMGHTCRTIVHPEAIDTTSLDGLDVTIGDHETVSQFLSDEHYDVAFIWGGRIEPDIQTAQLIKSYGTTPVFSELGWFPQTGHVYFDRSGTNAAMSHLDVPRLGVLARARFRKKQRRLCKDMYGVPFVTTPGTTHGPAKKVFVPLQDETDTNIRMDSPFQTMDALLGFLSMRYPDVHFVARVHPKAEPPKLSTYDNVELQDPSAKPYQTLSDFDLVAGINSTMLSEAAFIGCPVVCFGSGIARTYGLATYVDAANPPAALSDMHERTRRTDALAYLFKVKQLRQANLRDPEYVKRSYLGDLLGLTHA